MIFVTKFRANDLNASKGKQIEFNSGVAKDFFGFTKNSYSVEFECYSFFNPEIKEKVKVNFTLSPARGDYKIYQNEDGSMDLKDFFLRVLGLDATRNKDDYYAIKKKSQDKYILYYVPKESLFSQFFNIVSGDQILYMPDFEEYEDNENAIKSILPYLTAIRTKPFVLLAGISGTGKSRIVRKLAQATLTKELHKTYCPSYSGDFESERWTLHSPENFELIQVKPNWHNSMDVVGFKSNIGKEAHYEFTPFVEFIAKAWHHTDVPFFLCLDEMNLAPVEEYFAEFLSAIESRSINEEGLYQTDPIIKPFDDFGVDVCVQMTQKLAKDDTKLEWQFRKKGLTLPPNLIVMGTVNMDETTFSFSRKVLDRAMSIEMNEVNYDDFLSGKTEEEIPVLTGANSLLVDRPIKSQDILANIEADVIMEYLKSINKILEGTPFKLGYRAANEALLYVAAAKSFNNDNTAAALDDFTLMKILSRIEGDDSKLKTTFKDPDCGDDLLYHLKKLFTSTFSELDECKSMIKLNQMINILERDHFVSFWG